MALVNSVFIIVLFVVASILIISYVLGTIITIIRYYNYKVVQQGNHLKISYGLFNVKNLTVPTDRLQAVLEKQSFLRKYLDIPLYTLLSRVIWI